MTKASGWSVVNHHSEQSYLGMRYATGVCETTTQQKHGHQSWWSCSNGHVLLLWVCHTSITICIIILMGDVLNLICTPSINILTTRSFYVDDTIFSLWLAYLLHILILTQIISQYSKMWTTSTEPVHRKHIPILNDPLAAQMWTDQYFKKNHTPHGLLWRLKIWQLGQGEIKYLQRKTNEQVLKAAWNVRLIQSHMKLI